MVGPVLRTLGVHVPEPVQQPGEVLAALPIGKYITVSDFGWVATAIELCQGDGLQALPERCRQHGAVLVIEAVTIDLAVFMKLCGSCIDAELVR